MDKLNKLALGSLRGKTVIPDKTIRRLTNEEQEIVKDRKCFSCNNTPTHMASYKHPHHAYCETPEFTIINYYLCTEHAAEFAKDPECEVL